MTRAEFDRSSKIYSTVLLGLTTVFILFLVAPFEAAAVKLVAGTLLITAFVVYVASVASLIYRGTLTAPEDDSDSDSDSDSDDDSSEDDDHEGGDGTARHHILHNVDDDLVSDTDSDSGLEVGDEEQGRKKSRLLRHWSTTSDKEGHQLGLLRKPDSEKGVGSRKAIRRKKNPGQLVKQRKAQKPMRHHILRLAMGLTALLISSYIIAHSATTIGHELGLSGTVVGTTILSLATTLPEKFVAIMGGARHQPGIMVANTVGSNIFLVTLCGGVLFVWGDSSQLEMGVGFTLFEAAVMWLSAAVIFGIVIFTGGRRWMGVLMMVGYVSFLVVEIMHGRQLDDDDGNGGHGSDD